MLKSLLSVLAAIAVMASSVLPAYTPALAFERQDGFLPGRDVSGVVKLAIPFGPRTLPEQPAYLSLGLSASRDFDGHQAGLRDNVYYRAQLAEMRLFQDHSKSLHVGNIKAFEWDPNGNLMVDEERRELLGLGDGILGLAVLVALGIGIYLIVD